MPVEGYVPFRPEDVERYIRNRWWLDLTWGDIFNKATDLYPEKEALVDDVARFTYRELPTSRSLTSTGRNARPVRRANSVRKARPSSPATSSPLRRMQARS